MVYYHEEHLTAYEEGRNIPEALKAETDLHWARSYAHLKKASAVGAFMISADAETALRKMWKAKDKAIDPQDWYGQLESDYVAARDCLKSMVANATADLEIYRRAIPRRSNFRRPLMVAALLVFFVGGLWGVYALKDARVWPFSTGTRDVAFLNTTFGMSPQEVRRTLATFGTQLLTRDEYRSGEPTPNPMFGLTDSFVPLFWRDRVDTFSLIMPGVEMFDSKVEAEFSFRQNRLHSVSVYFDPITSRDAEAIGANVDKSLRTVYQFSNQEESKEVPGAYTLHYSSNGGRRALWVNLTDPEKPIIILTVVGPAVDAETKQLIESRQRSAFALDGA